MFDDKVLIYSMGRSGGSALSISLGALINDSEVCSEPFSKTGNFHIPKEAGESYKDQIDSFIDYIFQDQITVVKHNFSHMDHLGEYELKADQYIFDRFGRVILNSRNNRLKQAVSFVISSKTNTWSNYQLKPSEFYQHSFEIDLDDLVEIAERYRWGWNKRILYLKENSIPYIDLNYENFFNEIDLQSRISQLENITNNFLNLSFSYEHIGSVLKMLSSKEKQNNSKTYSIVENIHEINNKLGPKYGYLY